MAGKVKNDFAKRLIQFCLNVIKLSENSKRDLSKKIIFSQLIRCATSVGAIVTETKRDAFRKGFINYYQIAYQSSKKTNYWLVLAKASSPELLAAGTLLQKGEEIAKIISASLLTLKGKRPPMYYLIT